MIIRKNVVGRVFKERRTTTERPRGRSKCCSTIIMKNSKDMHEQQQELAMLVEEIKKKQQVLGEYNEGVLTVDENTFSTILYILDKPLRDPNEMLLLKLYLFKLSNFMKIIKLSKASVDQEDLVNKIACEIHCERYKRNSLIFRFGDKGDKFYIVLKGMVAVLITQETKIRMNEEDYIKYLIYLLKNNENELFNRIVMANRYIYNVENHYFESFIQEISTGKRKRNIYGQQVSLTTRQAKNIFEFHNSLSDVKDSTSNFEVEDYIKRLIPLPSTKKDDDSIIPEVTIFVYHNVTRLSHGDTFGDIALQFNCQRTASIITLEETYLGTITKEVYTACIKEAQEKLRKHYMTFILSNPIFIGINRDSFEKKYFTLFRLREIKQGESLIEQYHKRNEIYLIKEGEFEIYSKASLLDVNLFINELGGNNNEQSEIKLNEKYGSFQKFKELKQQKFRVAIVKEKDIIGFDDYVFDGKFFYTAVCLTVKAEIFSIEMPFLKEICSHDSIIGTNIRRYLTLRNKKMIERLTNMKNVFIQNFIQKEQRYSSYTNKPCVILKEKPKPNFQVRTFNQSKLTQNSEKSNNILICDSSPNLKNKNIISCRKELKQSFPIQLKYKYHPIFQKYSTISKDDQNLMTLSSFDSIEYNENIHKDQQQELKEFKLVGDASIEDFENTAKLYQDPHKLVSFSTVCSSSSSKNFPYRVMGPKITKKVLLSRKTSNLRADTAKSCNSPQQKRIKEIRTAFEGSSTRSFLFIPRENQIMKDIVNRIIEKSRNINRSILKTSVTSSSIGELKPNVIDPLMMDTIVKSFGHFQERKQKVFANWYKHKGSKIVKKYKR